MRVEIVSAAYDGKSIIASGQEQVNLYSEINKDDPQAPAKITYYPTPGTEVYAENTEYIFDARGCYRTSIGTAYYVVSQNVYSVGVDGTLTVIGIIANRPSLVKMKDNGLVVVLVDGVNGYVIDMASNNFGQITDPNFYGSDWVELLDTFFIFNRPDTNQFFISGSNVNFTMLTTTGAFDPLDIAAKSGFNDPIVGIASVHRELWLIGNLTTEVWIGTGAADFYFQQQQGAYINHGCGAMYSIATIDTIVFFLMQDQQGNGLVVMGGNYATEEISTPRTVKEFKSYATMEDAIGFCFQIGDHAFYCLIFPAASKGWMYDLTSKRWNEWNWCNENGNLLRPRVNCCMFFNNLILGGDWENGKLLELSLDFYMDEDQPIVCIRTFPHMTNNNEKITYNGFDLDAEVGTIEDQEATAEVSLSWSDDKGKTYGNPVIQSMGKTGEYNLVPTWNRLGQARDRVFKVTWSSAFQTAINGAFINFKRSKH